MTDPTWQHVHRARCVSVQQESAWLCHHNCATVVPLATSVAAWNGLTATLITAAVAHSTLLQQRWWKSKTCDVDAVCLPARAGTGHFASSLPSAHSSAIDANNTAQRFEVREPSDAAVAVATRVSVPAPLNLCVPKARACRRGLHERLAASRACQGGSRSDPVRLEDGPLGCCLLTDLLRKTTIAGCGRCPFAPPTYRSLHGGTASSKTPTTAKHGRHWSQSWRRCLPRQTCCLSEEPCMTSS